MAACSQMRDIFFRLGNLNSGGDDTMMGISRFYGRLGKAFDRVKMESDDPQVQNVGQSYRRLILTLVDDQQHC